MRAPSEAPPIAPSSSGLQSVRAEPPATKYQPTDYVGPTAMCFGTGSLRTALHSEQGLATPTDF